MRPSFLEEMKPRLRASFKAAGKELEGELLIRDLEDRKARRTAAAEQPALFGEGRGENR